MIAEIDQAYSIGVGMSEVAYIGRVSSGPVSRSTQLNSALSLGNPLSSVPVAPDTARDRRWAR